LVIVFKVLSSKKKFDPRKDSIRKKNLVKNFRATEKLILKKIWSTKVLGAQNFLFEKTFGFEKVWLKNFPGQMSL